MHANEMAMEVQLRGTWTLEGCNRSKIQGAKSLVHKSPHGVGLWKSICNLWREFNQRTSFRVGNGAFISFWKDNWLENIILKKEFPNLFLIAVVPNSTIAQSRSGLAVQKDVQGWELNDLLNCLNGPGSYKVTHKSDLFQLDSPQRSMSDTR